MNGFRALRSNSNSTSKDCWSVLYAVEQSQALLKIFEQMQHRTESGWWNGVGKRCRELIFTFVERGLGATKGVYSLEKIRWPGQIPARDGESRNKNLQTRRQEYSRPCRNEELVLHTARHVCLAEYYWKSN